LAKAKTFKILFRLAKANPNLSIASRFSGMTAIKVKQSALAKKNDKSRNDIKKQSRN
jgi:hypothetical protein